ncbi:DUF6143 family protein [Terrisporobacter vanillatitrophus]|uniref:DUF6143 family protein n=1 Tax=Terrisporobacter vanillatitrophus TaxID=3058402 RepID=UPI003365B601
MLSKDTNLNKEVSIEYPLFQSQKGHYFIGQTPILTGPDSQAIAALVNPRCSDVNIYLNAITVTNISGESLSAEIYLRSTPPRGESSPYVSCTNVTIVPPPQPNGEIKFNNIVTNPPANGVPIFSRIVPGFSTTVIDGGQIIIPPNSCILVYLGGFLPVEFDSAIVAFGWWEERINKYCCESHCCYN